MGPLVSLHHQPLWNFETSTNHSHSPNSRSFNQIHSGKKSRPLSPNKKTQLRKIIHQPSTLQCLWVPKKTSVINHPDPLTNALIRRSFTVASGAVRGYPEAPHHAGIWGFSLGLSMRCILCFLNLRENIGLTLGGKQGKQGSPLSFIGGKCKREYQNSK